MYKKFIFIKNLIATHKIYFALVDILLRRFFPLSLPLHLFFFFVVVIPDTLTDMVNQMTEKVGLVHGLPYVADRQGFAATLEQVSVMS